MINVIERFQALRQHQQMLNLYALVDGFQYEQHTGQRIQHRRGIIWTRYARTSSPSILS